LPDQVQAVVLGIVAGINADENITLGQLGKHPSGGVLRVAGKKALARKWRSKLSIMSPCKDQTSGAVLHLNAGRCWLGVFVGAVAVGAMSVVRITAIDLTIDRSKLRIVKQRKAVAAASTPQVR
jgi:hypothetical protein